MKKTPRPAGRNREQEKKDMEQYVTEAELCAILKVSRSCLWEMRTAEGLPFCRIGRLVRYRPDEVADWMSENRGEEVEWEEGQMRG